MRMGLLLTVLLFQHPAPPVRPTLPQPPLLARFVEDMRAKKLEDVLSLYARDAVFIDPSGAKFSTPDQLRGLYKQVFATYDSDLSVVGGEGYGLEPGAPGPYKIATASVDWQETLRTRATNTSQALCGHLDVTWKNEGHDHWLITEMKWSMAKVCPVRKP